MNNQTQVSQPSVKQQQKIKTNTYKKGSFWERAVAYILDLIIIFLIQFVLGLLLGLILGSKNLLGSLLSYIIPVLYAIFFLGIAGATLGMKMLKLKTLNTSYKKIGMGTSFLREIATFLSSLVLNLGYFWMLIDAKEQTWHDKLAHTFVVKLDATGNLIPTAGDRVVTTGRKVAFWILFLVFGTPPALVTVFLVVYVFLFRPFQINGQAMAPTLPDRAYILANIAAVRTGQLQRGDIITFQAPTDPNKDFVKRVIGLPGDTVMLNNGSLLVNGQMLDESKYLNTSVETYGGAFLHDGQTITVPNGQYFVLGDNRPNSSDSREWGFVPISSVIGKDMFCYFNCSGQPSNLPRP